MDTEVRIATLERQYEALANRLSRLERAARRPDADAPPRPVDLQTARAPVAGSDPSRGRDPRPRGDAASSGATPPSKVERRTARRARPATGDTLEDLLGGRVLAWAGGLAVLLGVVFLFTIAVSRGWIGEGERVLLAGAGSTALLLAGIWLHERRGRTDAARAAVGSALAALFATVTVAARVYDLIPPMAGFAFAILIGALGTVLAVRWAARPIAVLGIVGALLAPVAVAAPAGPGTLALLVAAAAAACGVAVWQRWEWIALAVLLATTPQWAHWALDAAVPADLVTVVAVMMTFGVLGALAAVGYELRVPVEPRVSSAFALLLNALALSAIGSIALEALSEGPAWKTWLAGVAVAHLAAGAVAWRSRRIAREVDLLLLTVGVIVGDVALGTVLDGPALAIAWAAGGAAFALALRRLPEAGLEPGFAGAGLGGHLALALGHALTSDAPIWLLEGGGASAGGIAVLVTLASACFVSARIAAEGRPGWRVALDAAGLAVTAYLAAVTLDGATLAAVWALEAIALGQFGRRTGDGLAARAAVVHIALALVHAVAFEAPPEALLNGLGSVPAAALALGAAAAAAAWCAHLRIGEPGLAPVLGGVAALALLHLASTAVVTPFAGGGSGLEGVGFDGRQQGQVALSALWALTGVAALLVGLRRDLRPVRLAALGLLLTTVAKVFLYDLRALDSGYRVVSFIGLGLLLLLGAFAWQRARPRALPDLREAPGHTP